MSTRPVPTESLLTTRQAAEWLAVSPATILRRWREGSLPGYRISSNSLRFSASEIEQWLETRRSRSELPAPEQAAPPE
jgi:excisionase family DNA binding protein